MAGKEHDQLVFWSDVASGYRGIIAIHDTALGPALGGTRFWNYESEAGISPPRMSGRPSSTWSTFA